MYSQILTSPDADRRSLGSIRTCISGAMKLPPEIVDAFQAATGGRLVEGYGLTESSPVAIANPLNANARAGTLGLPVSSTRARIVSEHDPTLVLPVGEAGELVVHGPQVFQGYWNQIEDSGQMLMGGWLRTGDIAVMSPDGFFTIIDRKRDVIVASGFSIYPSEIEDVIRLHPAVEDCAVIGVPDEYRGETVKACVVVRQGMRLTEAELRQHCAAQLTGYKVPKIYEMRADLPRNMLGKVLRRILREEHALATATSRETAE
jgi:long-chain acyl-CoA synthetase